MPPNNQKVQSAADRLAKLPVVQSALSSLSLLYTDTKSSHPSLKSVCEALENSVTAISALTCHGFAPVIVKLEPQISIAMNVASISFDWLETAFPIIHSPTEQIVATAKNKMHEVQSVVIIAAGGTVECVQHTAHWLIGSQMQQVDHQAAQPFVERALGMARVGLDSSLIMSEALMDRMLPPSEHDRQEEAHFTEGFEASTLGRSYPVKLVSLAAKLCRRTYHMLESWSRSPDVVQDLQTSILTLTCSIQELPQYLQNQLLSLLNYQMTANLRCPTSQSNGDNHANGHETPKNGIQEYKKPIPAFRRKKPTWSVTPVFDLDVSR